MPRAILTDIEGTTSSLAFVKDVLFPYSRAQLPDYVRQHANDPAVRVQLNETARCVGRPLDDEAAIAQLLDWIDEDRKITPLKAIQGKIWQVGYERGDYHGHVYDDVPDALNRWRKLGLSLYVFSSGSVLAQKLLFAHTAHGDLTPLFAGFFDTTIGNKREPQAYHAIAEAIGLPAGELLFLSDVMEELDAAKAAGLHTTQVLREGVSPAPGHPQVKNFREIRLT